MLMSNQYLLWAFLEWRIHEFLKQITMKNRGMAALASMNGARDFRPGIDELLSETPHQIFRYCGLVHRPDQAGDEFRGEVG